MINSKLKLERATTQGLIKAARLLAKMIPDVIRERTSSGMGLKNELPALSKSYIKFREKYSRKLAKTTSPSKSNLTATGQMLRAIVGEASGFIVKIFISDKSRKKSLGGSTGPSNKEIRGYVEGQGREFLGLKYQEKIMIQKFAAEKIKEEIKRAFK